MRKLPLMIIGAACLLAACNPAYNWRNYASPDSSYTTMFPDKPATHTRLVDLGTSKVELTMAAAEVDDVVFAVATGVVPEAGQAPAAVDAMKVAMVRNIGARITSEKRTGGASVDIEASGNRGGQAIRLAGHFEARGARIYQVIVMGPEGQVEQEQVEQFMEAFKAKENGTASVR